VLSEDGKTLLVDDDYRQRRATRGMPNTWSEYEALFDGVAGENAIGEASPEYSSSIRAADQIHRFLPSVRLIVSLRRPSDRLYSMSQMNNREQELDFADFFRTQKNSQWVTGQFTHESLEHYYKLFGAGQIHVVKFEDLSAEPKATLADICRYL